jgi:hypothetical protein
MSKYTKSKLVKITEEQSDSLKVIDSYGINTSQFIRLAIKEKIKRDFKKIKQDEYTPY